MARITTCTLRIASLSLPHNVNLAIAAQIFVAAGVVILYIVNLVFAQRLIRAAHPHIGWTKPFSWAFKALYALVFITIIMLITVVVQSFFTLDRNIRRIDRDIQLYGVTMFAVLAFLPLPLVLTSLAIPRKVPLDKFGTGRWRTKLPILLAGATLISFGAAYRAGTTWLTPVQRSQPLPAFDNKAAFYIVNFGVEIIVVYLYAFTRVDKRFHVHDGATARRSYANPDIKENIEAEAAAIGPIASKSEETFAPRPMTSRSEETFADKNTLVGNRWSGLGSAMAMKSEETLPDHGNNKTRHSLLPAVEYSEPSAPTADPLAGKKLENV